MSRFIESIKILDGRIVNLENHAARFNNTRLNFFPVMQELELGLWIHVPEECRKGLFKCRVTYGEEIEKIEFIPYDKPVVRSLKIVYDDDIEYSFKYENRYALDHLLEKKGNHDDIIIVKNNLVTDTSYCNIIMLKGGKWYTPKHPLLKGTKRQELLSLGKIEERVIHADDLTDFELIGLINSMNEPGECLVDIDRIS